MSQDTGCYLNDRGTNIPSYPRDRFRRDTKEGVTKRYTRSGAHTFRTTSNKMARFDRHLTFQECLDRQKTLEVIAQGCSDAWMQAARRQRVSFILPIAPCAVWGQMLLRWSLFTPRMGKCLPIGTFPYEPTGEELLNLRQKPTLSCLHRFLQCSTPCIRQKKSFHAVPHPLKQVSSEDRELFLSFSCLLNCEKPKV